MTNLIIEALAVHGGGKGTVVSSAFGTTVVKVKDTKKFANATRSGVKGNVRNKLNRLAGEQRQRRQETKRNRQIAEQFQSKNYKKDGTLSSSGKTKVQSLQKRRAKQGK